MIVEVVAVQVSVGLKLPVPIPQIIVPATGVIYAAVEIFSACPGIITMTS
jgi:hypothetical protein